MKVDTLSGDVVLDLPEFDDPPNDPFALLRRWIDVARPHVREPLALSLATVDGEGQPSSRVVLVKDVDDRGLTFTTHSASRKGQDASATGRAAATLYWRETMQQINLAGAVEVLPDAESDALFAERPRAAQATTAVSRQGAPLAAGADLAADAAALLAGTAPIPRPPGWCGYRLVPHHIEFWAGSTDRLHRRLAYSATAGQWLSARLQP